MRVRPVHVSCLKEPRNALAYRHLSFHFCLLLFFVGCGKSTGPRFAGVSVSETENVEVVNGALFMTQNVAERVS